MTTFERDPDVDFDAAAEDLIALAQGLDTLVLLNAVPDKMRGERDSFNVDNLKEGLEKSTAALVKGLRKMLLTDSALEHLKDCAYTNIQSAVYATILRSMKPVDAPVIKEFHIIQENVTAWGKITPESYMIACKNEILCRAVEQYFQAGVQLLSFGYRAQQAIQIANETLAPQEVTFGIEIALPPPRKNPTLSGFVARAAERWRNNLQHRRAG